MNGARGYGACFNPRLRTGGDRGGVLDEQLDLAFQSTPPHGRRSKELILFVTSRCFNPRLRTGGDISATFSAPCTIQFQSTPPHGRRPRFDFIIPWSYHVSIHASAREATAPEH